MGNTANYLQRLIDPKVQDQVTSQVMRDLQTTFAGQQNNFTDMSARTNLGRDAQLSGQRGLNIQQNQTTESALTDLQKFFQQLKFQQAQLWLQNKGLNINRKLGEDANRNAMWSNTLDAGATAYAGA